MNRDPFLTATMLARGLDPKSGDPLPDPTPVPERIRKPTSIRTGRVKKTVSGSPAAARKPPVAESGFRFTIIDETQSPPAIDDFDALAVQLPLHKYLARRRANPGERLSGANRYQRTALIALEQQWTIEYWRARALYFERMQRIDDLRDEVPALRGR